MEENIPYTVFFSPKDQQVTDNNVTSDLHVYKLEDDYFKTVSNDYFQFDYSRRKVIDLEETRELKIINTWLDHSEKVRFVELSQSLLRKCKMSVEEILLKYQDYRNKTWKEMKGNSEFVTFRKLFVDALLKESMENLDCKHTCSFSSVGSVTNFSDYDVNVTGIKSTEIVEVFNQRFREIFGKESSEVFDTNVYGSSFVREVRNNNFEEYYVKNSEGEEQKYRIVSVNTERDRQSQRKWALIKLFLNLDHKERYPLRDAYQFIEKKWKELFSMVKDRSDDRMMNEYYVEMLKLNKEYAKKMMGPKIKDKDFSDSLKFHYKDSLSRANYFGNEMYFTQGAFIHVVMNIQSKVNIPMTKHEYMDSFIENMGDCFKVLNDYEKGENEKPLCQKIMESVSKYFSRATDALVKLGYNEIQDLYMVSEEVREKVRNKEKSLEVCPIKAKDCVEEGTAWILNQKFMHLMGIENCKGLRSYFMKFLQKYLRLG